jgi:hypothetical protein
VRSGRRPPRKLPGLPPTPTPTPTCCAQLTVGELFTPLFLVEGPDDAAAGDEGGKEGEEGQEGEPGAAKGSSRLRQLAMRAGVGASLAGVMYFLYAHAPDKGERGTACAASSAQPAGRPGRPRATGLERHRLVCAGALLAV